MKRLLMALALTPMMVLADRETVNGIEWTYDIKDGKAHVNRAVSSNAVDVAAIPFTLGGCPVTSIGRDEFRAGFGWRVFEKCRDMRSVIIPTTVTIIGDSAFYGCSNLTAVTIPASVEKICRCAFSHCGNLMSFTVEDKNEKYSSRNGLLCSKDGRTLVAGVNGDVTIPANVKNVGEYAFEGCSGLRSVAVPEGVTQISHSAFGDCSGLTNATISSSVRRIEWYAFNYCGLTSFSVHPDNPSYSVRNGMLCSKDGRTLVAGVNGDVTIPACVKKIGYYAFSGYKGIKSIEIPENVERVDSGAFKGCASLVSVKIPSSVKSIEADAFYGCAGLRSFNVDRKNEIYSSANGLLLSKDGRTLINGVIGDVIIPPGVTNISGFAFGGLQGLRSVVIPHGVTEIAESMFGMNMNLESVSIPASVNRIAGNAFIFCSNLKSLTIHSNVTNIDSTAFIACGLETVNIVDNGKPQTISFDDFKKRWKPEDTADGRRAGRGVLRRARSASDSSTKVPVAKSLQKCDFLVNRDFKKNAKVYLCLFSASWCGPCRAEMPRIAKIYAETLKNDPDIELIQFSRDRDESKGLAWAKEHNVKFPVVKYNGGNPLNLWPRGIPHLFIVRADGTLLERGHPKKLFTNEKLREMYRKAAEKGDKDAQKKLAKLVGSKVNKDDASSDAKFNGGRK